MLDEDEINALVADMWQLHLTERAWLDRIYDYTKGVRGAPRVPDGASQEVKDLAKLSVLNMLGLIRDSFVQNLSVVAYRTATAKGNSPSWASWQRNRMDARQAEVIRPAVTYGASYLAILPGENGPIWRPRSPRQLLAVYADPHLDEWPEFALETWIDKSKAKPRRKGLFYDDTHTYELDLGELSSLPTDENRSNPVQITEFGEVKPHRGRSMGKAVCPIVRFVNDRDADDLILGEIAPLISRQQQINNVNFDRLIVSRHGAHPQKVITGWAGTKDETLAASAKRVWTFEDPDVKAQSFPAANLSGYNDLLSDLIEDLFAVAQVSPMQAGKLVNVSAETLAAAEANQKRKEALKRESFGESYEQAFRLDAEMSGEGEVDLAAECVWRDTEARAFGAVVDGVTKLAQQGVPIEEMLYMVPGMTQQRMKAISDKIRATQGKAEVQNLVQQLRTKATAERQDPAVSDLASRRGDQAAPNAVTG